MSIPADWFIDYHWGQNGTVVPNDPRGVCPHCRNASTFSIQKFISLKIIDDYHYSIYTILQCNSTSCGGIVYLATSVESSSLRVDRTNDDFFIHPSRAIDKPHPAVPKAIAEDWTEAQKAMEAGALKAAAVMCRRVLYGAILDKKCKEHPLHEGLKELIEGQRLPAIFDDWLPAIKDDGHDAAHPHRALDVNPENIAETMEYTSELLRFLYIEPYEFQQRKAKNTPNP